MSKLSEMIARLCPNGVEYKKLGEVAEIGTGSSNRNEAVEDGLYPFFVRSQTVERMNKFEFDEEAIIIPGEGGIGDIFHHVNGKYALHQRVYRIHFVTSSLDTRFAYYYLTAYFKKFILGKAVTATVTSIRKPMIENFSIPLPPLPIQREIVQILDNFANLTAELTAELAKRKKQYEHYRRELFTGSVGKKYLLENLCSVITDGSHFSPKSSEEGYDMPSVKDMTANGFDYSECKKISRSDYELLVRNGCQPQVGDVLIAKDGALMLKHAFPFDGQREIVLLSSIALLRPRQEIILPKFLAYYFRRNEFKEEVIRKFSTKGGVPRIILKNFKKVELLVPPLAEQERIVAILDRFDSLCNSLTEGLPAEIALRKKQYEYYRDKLLSFKEAG